LPVRKKTDLGIKELKSGGTMQGVIGITMAKKLIAQIYFVVALFL
jgi:hypothetical protein